MIKHRIMTSFIIIFGIVVSGFFILGSSSTFASTTVSLLGLGDYSRMNLTPTTAIRGSLAGGGGIDLGVGNRRFSIHLGAFYDPKSYNYDANSITITVKENRLLVPLSLWWTPSMFVFEVGGYGSMGIGNLSYFNNTTVTTSTSVSYADWGIRSIDYGVIAGFGFNIPISHLSSLLVMGKYQYGLYNNAIDTTTTYKYNSILAILGWTFHLGQGQH